MVLTNRTPGATLDPCCRSPRCRPRARSSSTPAARGRALRVSWHAEADVTVLSLWQGGTCTGTFRLAVEDIPDLIEALRDGLARSYDVHRDRRDRVEPA